MMTFDRIPPAGPCTDPDGHEWEQTMRMGNPIPETCFCPNCGEPWIIVTFSTKGEQR